jgi:hypothetical protein
MYEVVRACLRREAAQLRFAPRRPRLYAGLTCAVFLIWALLGYLLPEQQWDRDRDGAWRGYKGRSSYCESIRHTPKNHPHDPAPNVTGLGMFMAQPANALSNYCFVVYGFVLAALFCGDVLRRTRRTSVTAAVVPDAGHEAAKAADREAAEAATVATMAAASSLTVHPRNNIFFFPLWTLALAICLALLGITSFLYHASLTHLAQTLDVAAIYWGLTVMGSANLSKFFILIPNVTCRWWCNMMMLVLSACVGSPLLFEYKKKMNSTEMLVILVLTNVGLMTLHWLLFRAKVAVSWKWMGLSAVSLALAAYFRQGEVDKWGMPCDPESFFQGHSMWHFLTATSFFQAYMFMRSERHKVEDGGGVRPENVGVFGWMRGCCCCGGGGGGGGNGSSQAGAGGGASGAAVASSKGYPVRCGDVEMAETKESSKEGEDESKVAAQVV